MIYYGIAAIFPLIMWFIHDYVVRVNRLDEKAKKKLTWKLTLMAILPMFLLFVFRDKSIGADTIGYVRFFQKDIRTYSFAQLFDQDLVRMEIGFRLYVKIISLFTDNYTVYFFVNGAVLFGSLLRFSLKYTKNPFVFFFLFITLGTYAFFETGLRQALAMVICLWSIDFIKKKKIIPFILLVLIAYFFHKSAIVFMLVYPLGMIRRYDWMVFLYAILAVVFTVGFTFFQNLFNQLLGYEYEIEETGNGGIFMLFVLILFIYSSLMNYGKKGDEKAENAILHLSFLTVIFWLLRLISRTAERMSFYFMFGLYGYFAQAIGVDRDKVSSLLKWLLILACMVLFVYRNMNTTYLFFLQST